MRLLAYALLCSLLIGSDVFAHGLWLEQRRGQIEAVYGHGAEDEAFAPEKITGAWAYDLRGKMIPVTIERHSDHARLVPLRPVAAIAAVMDNGAWSRLPDGTWSNQGRNQAPNALESLHSIKYSVAIHAKGARLPELNQLKLVIVPEVDPLTVGPGQSLPVRVLMDGSPLAGVELIGDYRGAPNLVSARTDAQGRARVAVRNEGLNIISAEVEVPVKGDANIERRSLFTSLTFIGQPHHE